LTFLNTGASTPTPRYSWTHSLASNSCRDEPPDANNEWCAYDLLWTSKRLTWYFNDKVVSTTAIRTAEPIRALTTINRFRPGRGRCTLSTTLRAVNFCRMPG
jgi:hypothetical protein